MKKQTANILIGVLAVAAIAAYLLRDKIEALFAGQPLPPPPAGTATGNGSTTPADNGSGTTVSTPPIITYTPGQPVKSKVAQCFVRSANNTTLGGPFSNGQYIGAFVANPAGSQFQIIYAGQTGFVFKNEVTVG